MRGIKKWDVERLMSYLSELPVPVAYAQIITKPTVRSAPQNPESTQSRPTVGKLAMTHGMIFWYVALAMIPAIKPRTANITKILNLSCIFSPWLYHSFLDPF